MLRWHKLPSRHARVELPCSVRLQVCMQTLMCTPAINSASTLN